MPPRRRRPRAVLDDGAAAAASPGDAEAEMGGRSSKRAKTSSTSAPPATATAPSEKKKEERPPTPRPSAKKLPRPKPPIRRTATPAPKLASEPPPPPMLPAAPIPAATLPAPSTPPEQPAPPATQASTCDLCQLPVSAADLKLHQRRCGGDQQSCGGCDHFFAQAQLLQHEPVCLRASTQQDDDERGAMAAERVEMHRSGMITSAQLSALQHVATKAKTLSDAARPSVVARLRTLGYDAQHLNQMLRFVRNHAPLLVHVNLSLRQKLLSDTHYRSQFETGVSCGQLAPAYRTQAESNMFGQNYTQATAAFDRVKYGCMNTSVDPNGVMSATGYGDSYFLLRSETVRPRVTIAHCDTLGCCPPLGTCDHFCHVLQHYTDAELLDALSVALGEKRFATTQASCVYKELQVHGPIQLDRDVTALALHPRHATDAPTMQLVEQFRAKNDVEVIQLELRVQR